MNLVEGCVTSSISRSLPEFERCGFSDTFLIYVHRFDQNERTCRCGRKTIDEPPKRRFGTYGRSRKKPDEDDD